MLGVVSIFKYWERPSLSLATATNTPRIPISGFLYIFNTEIPISGFSFKDALLAENMKNGGLPYIAKLAGETEKIDMYLEGIYNTMIAKDIEERQKRTERDPNKRTINDIALLKNISKFLASSVGSPVSMKSIADYITSGGRSISQATVSDYVDALVEPYIFYPAERYNVLGKQLLKTNQKM